MELKIVILILTYLITLDAFYLAYRKIVHRERFLPKAHWAKIMFTFYGLNLFYLDAKKEITKRFKRNFFTLFLLVMLVTSPIKSASAEGEAPSIFDTTTPIDGQIIADVNAWLAESAPAPYPHWALTYAGKPDAIGDVFVSLVAVDITDTTAQWYLDDRHPDDGIDENVIRWMGSVVVHADHSVSVFSDGGYSQSQTNALKIAAPISMPVLDGGGSNVRFPWQFGKSVIYGVRGIHQAGNSWYAIGFSAVDFLGGDDLGTGIASNRVLSVATGEVDFRCKDTKTVTIRTKSDDEQDYYIYAHLMDNSSLIEGYTFYQGDTIGYLKYGSFDDTCGWAEQTENHFHLHFGFKPANNAFKIGGCILDMNTEKWACGTETVSPGGTLKNLGSTLTTGDDASAYSNQMSFWDYILIGANQLVQALIIDHLPDHQSNSYLYALYNAVNITVRIARVMVYQNISLSWIMAVLAFALPIKGLFFLAEVAAFVAKAWKSLIPIVGA